MELIIKILPDREITYYPCSCDNCGWYGSSEHLGGGGQIADTGDYDDVYCPICGSKDTCEDENEIPITSLVDRLHKSNALLKKFKDKAEECDCSKHIYSYYEIENAEMAKEIKSLKAQLESKSTA